ncbi:MAG TPA: RNA polymerase sigma factor [Caulobacteraceae bacterium]|jgi:RNA polymerase sigma-70 factor (ECF subfamily)|nr:RNA polymerase sigma factor [Caulobacteraceae bacterium]
MNEDPFAVQADVRGPWRTYLDALTPLRPELHRYCTRLTGNVWDGEDLAQDALAKVFSMLGKIDADLQNPRAYLIRTATNLWIDRVRRLARERETLQLEAASAPTAVGAEGVDGTGAAGALFQALHPQERAAIVLKEALDLSLEESAQVLRTSVGAVKAALSRARGRLSQARPAAGFAAPPRELVQKFMVALRDTDLEGLKALCSADLAIELVGGAQSDSFESGSSFFAHAHFVFPALGFGENPWWELAEYEGEPIVVGYRTLDGVEGINEIHRLDVEDGKIARVRCYCFAPDTLRWVAAELGKVALDRRYRSPDPRR